MEGYERRYDLLNEKFKEFFLPTLFISLAMNISTLLNTFIVSFTLGAMSLSIIQVIIPIITFINLLYWMIGLGGSILSSISMSEYKKEEANIYFTLSISILVLIGIIISAICFFNTDAVANLLCQDKSILPDVKDYLLFILIGFPFLAYIMSISYFIRADGKPNLSFKALLLANIFNLILDLVFIIGLNMNIEGAALATSIGYIVGSIYISKYFFSNERTLHFISVKKLKISSILHYYKNIIFTGFPGASSQLFLTIKVLFFNTVIGLSIGASGLVAFSICYNSLYILYIFLIGTSQSMLPIVSIFYKERDFSAVKHTIYNSLKIVTISSFILSLLFIIWPEILITIYSVHGALNIETTTHAIRIFAISYLGTAITFLYLFYLQSIQKTLFSFLISLSQGLIFPLSFAIVLPIIFGINSIWLAFALAEIATIIIISISVYYKNKKSKTSGFFMIPQEDEGILLELSVKNNSKDIVNLSEKIIKFVKENGVNNKKANLVGLSLEEMVINIINNNPNVKVVDILLRINNEKITLSIKDQGKEFNPTLYKNEDKNQFDNITVLQRVSDDIKYSRVIGLNSTVITINR